MERAHVTTRLRQLANRIDTTPADRLVLLTAADRVEDLTRRDNELIQLASEVELLADAHSLSNRSHLEPADRLLAGHAVRGAIHRALKTAQRALYGVA